MSVNDVNNKTSRIIASADRTAHNDMTPDNVPTGDVVYLCDIAKLAGKSPKSVRARFRRMYANVSRTSADDNERMSRHLPRVIDRKRWAFASSDFDAVLALVVNNTRVDTPDMQHAA